MRSARLTHVSTRRCNTNMRIAFINVAGMARQAELLKSQCLFPYSTEQLTKLDRGMINVCRPSQKKSDEHHGPRHPESCQLTHSHASEHKPIYSFLVPKNNGLAELLTDRTQASKCKNVA